MAPRGRGRRGRGGAAATTRSTRNAGQDNDATTVEDTQDQMMEAGVDVPMREPPPRRNAPPAVSEFSIEPGAGSDLEVEAIQAEHAAVEADFQEEVSDEETLAVMVTGLPDARRHSEDLWNRLKTPDYENLQYRVSLHLKRKAFQASRSDYEDDFLAPFVDTRRLRLLDELAGGQGAVFTTLRKMNLATALDTVDRLLRNEKADKLAFLEGLARGVYPFLLNGDSENRIAPQQVLEICTQVLIEKFAIDNTDRHPFAIVAEVFCPGQDIDDYAHLFSHGPFVSLGGDRVEFTDGEGRVELRKPADEDLLVADRIQHLLTLVKKKGRALAALRDNYDPEIFLKELRDFLLNSWPASTEADDFYDAPESLMLEATPGYQRRQSQPPGSAPSRQQMHDVERLALASPPANRRSTVAPIQQQQQQRYPSPDANVGTTTEEASHAAAQSLAQLGEHISNEDDDPFQTDYRANAPAPKRPATGPPISGQRPARRQRINDAALPPSSMAPPSTAPPQYSTQASNIPDFEAVKAKKKAISAAARADRGEMPTQQRKPWSTKDCMTLLNCIFERHASWSQIESVDKEKFEVERNQQAFRDKARNMKVDYLITDAPLPPCFDMVALGQKEKKRLIDMGKNPYRREADVDEDGNPINISYAAPAELQLEAPITQTQEEPLARAPEPTMS